MRVNGVAWRSPLNGLPLENEISRTLRKVGFTNASDISDETIGSTGYIGAIHLKDGKVTYLYR